MKISDCLLGTVRLAAIASLGALAACSESAMSQGSELQAIQAPANSDEEQIGHSIGDEYTPCEDCPTFVRVPNAPDNLRPIRYVSKFELTWNSYLAAVDDGSCPIPNKPIGHSNHFPNDVADNLDKFRLDYAITELSLPMMECYVVWLNRKVDSQVIIPTMEEWQWFATGGKSGQKYPWGNDPAEGAGATVIANPVVRNWVDPWSSHEERTLLGHHLSLFSVGQFQSNPWGIHDLMGGSKELTASTRTKAQITGSEAVGEPAEYHIYMGSSSLDQNWESASLDKPGGYTRSLPLGFSVGGLGLRLVLVEAK
jgi:hypothetical protein